MHIGYRIVLLVAAAWLALASAALAQLFGSRTLGQPVSLQPPPIGGAAVGHQRFRLAVRAVLAAEPLAR